MKREKESAASGDKETEYNGLRVVENTEIMRLQLFFDDKPAADVRERLKANGFRWSPKIGCWQRQLTDNARRALKWYINEFIGLEG